MSIRMETGNFAAGRTGRIDVAAVEQPSIGRTIGQETLIDGEEFAPKTGLPTHDEQQALVAQQELAKRNK